MDLKETLVSFVKKHSEVFLRAGIASTLGLALFVGMQSAQNQAEQKFQRTAVEEFRDICKQHGCTDEQASECMKQGLDELQNARLSNVHKYKSGEEYVTNHHSAWIGDLKLYDKERGDRDALSTAIQAQKNAHEIGK